MDLLLDIFKHILWMVFWLAALIAVVIFTLPGGGRRKAPKWFIEKRHLIRRLNAEALHISTPAEKEAFIRKLDECRPRLWKEEKEGILRHIGLRPPRPNNRPVAMKPPLEVEVRHRPGDDTSSR